MSRTQNAIRVMAMVLQSMHSFVVYVIAELNVLTAMNRIVMMAVLSAIGWEQSITYVQNAMEDGRDLIVHIAVGLAISNGI